MVHNNLVKLILGLVVSLVGPLSLAIDSYPAPGEFLEAGMILKFRTGGGRKIGYKVNQINHDYPVSNFDNCTRISIFIGDPAPYDSVQCISNDFLYQSAGMKEMTKDRPVGENLTMEKVGARSGVKYRYVTKAKEHVVIAGREVSVIHTEIYFYKSGKLTHRLIEKYSPALSMATFGRYEYPDTREEDGWSKGPEFHLIEIN